jgi:hypothetical protein
MWWLLEQFSIGRGFANETDFGGGGVRDNPEINKYIASQTALGRVGLPDDIGGALAFAKRLP